MMEHTVEKGKTLLVDGPASVSLLSGAVEVLGATLKVGDKIVIREGKRMPFEVRKRAAFDLMLSEEVSFEEVDGSTIPSSWEDTTQKILSHEKPVTVMVMGGIDSGKTSLCTYLANKALREGWKVAIIDADVGQSDIGPPSTIGFSRVAVPIKDLFEVETENAYFVGLTSPSGAINKVMEGLTALRDRALEMGVNCLVINTDGWVEGEDAASYKVKLTEKVAPDIVVGIQQGDELAPIITALKGVEVLSIESPPAIRRRDREKRKVLRELSYKKYLKGAKILTLLLSWVRVEGAPTRFGTTTTEHMEKINDLLGTSAVYCEETPNASFIILRKNQWVDGERVKRAEQSLLKRVKIIREGEEEGLLVALHDWLGNFLGIGVLCAIDYERGVMKIYTPIRRNISTIRVGQIKLDKKGREIGISPVFADYE
ncbi:MAG: Polyribonucleotide 5'-hydroxyl-kinase [Candidatus Bathyarchaeota archaeon BA1]|nr:MAG: Polyribonucleotide 5'-hydroxyl-kinase [Candidatus Bathyarchaeota archaeon BA1]